MKKAFITLSLIVCAWPFINEAKPRTTYLGIIRKCGASRQARAAAARNGTDEKTQKILSQFFDIVGSFFAIVQNPNDQNVITANITNMLAGAVNIVAEGVKSGTIVFEDEDSIQKKQLSANNNSTAALLRVYR